MSFNCDKCRKHFSGSPKKLVVNVRPKIYPKRFAKDGKTTIDEGGKGYEIVEEIDVCKNCFLRVENGNG